MLCLEPSNKKAKPPATFSTAKCLVHAELIVMTTQSREPALVKFGAVDEVGTLARTGQVGQRW